MYNLIKKFLVTLEVKIIYFVVPLKIIIIIIILVESINKI